MYRGNQLSRVLDAAPKKSFLKIQDFPSFDVLLKSPLVYHGRPAGSRSVVVFVFKAFFVTVAFFFHLFALVLEVVLKLLLRFHV